MPRVTLYVPDGLKARMDEAGEAVNWSAVAQRAFREAIAIHSVRKDHSDMQNVVERLKASKERFLNREFETGKEAGGEWAKTGAEYHELESVAKFDADTYEGEIDFSTFEWLVDRDEEWGRDRWRQFWETHYGRGNPSSSFIKGFIEGASDVYSEIAEEL